MRAFSNLVFQKLIPALTGQSTPNGNTRALLALPVQLGGMGIVNLTTLPTVQHQSSVALCKPLSSLIDSQELHANMAAACKDQAAIKGAINKKHRFGCKKEAENVIRDLPPKQQRCAQAAQEKGTSYSSWLSALPIKSFGFALHKDAFKDAVALRYGWPLQLTEFPLTLTMSCHAAMGASCHCGTTRQETCWPDCSQKSAQTFAWSHAFSRCQGKAFQRPPRRIMKLGWTSVCEVFGVFDNKTHSLM